MTKALSRSERNIAAISMNSTTSAITKLRPMLRTTSPSRSALPEMRMAASGGSASRRLGTISSLTMSSASSSDIAAGGSTVRVTVRRRSMRRSWFGASTVSTCARSARLSTPPCGVASGAAPRRAMSSSPLLRRMIARRRSPSKCSPSHCPSPSVRTTVPSSGRRQPISARRRSSGLTRSSGVPPSALGQACTLAPAKRSDSALRPASAARASASPSLCCRWMAMARAEPPKLPNSSPSLAKARVSGKPTTISSRTMRSSSPMSSGSTTRAPSVPPPGHRLRYQLLSCGPFSPSM